MKRVKTITMYLPQFHRIPENDEWWGEGFTDWMAVKASKPLYVNHKQPRIPLNNNYYDLLDKNTMVWQADLMHKYGIDGQCFYHYYFEGGRKILEKPAENLLRWKDIDMPFCFCWDVGRWVRTWSNVRGNSWADTFEKKEGKDGEGVLLEQKFGGKEDWYRHFEYLYPFFVDERYIKIDGSPVFILHNPSSIYCLKEMMGYWKLLARQRGLLGVYVIGSNLRYKISGVDAILLHSPHMFWKLEKDSTKEDLSVFDYEETWNRIIQTLPIGRCKTYYMGITDCDDTPRRGKNGIVLQNFSLEKFYENLCKLYRKSFALGNEFLFINAWNEWGEGMYLEPDEDNGYKYLEIVRQARIDAEQEENDYEIAYDTSYDLDQLEAANSRCEKWRKTANCLERWMVLREEKRNLAEYMYRFGIRTVAIYGMGILGKRLLTEFRGSSIKIKYLIDRNHRQKIESYNLISPDEQFAPVDAVIVTVINEFDSICENLKSKTDAKLISIEELVYEI